MAADGYEADRSTQKGASTVTNEEITRAIMEKGWEIRYRGGNSKCTTPNDLDVIVADMPGSLGGKRSTPWLELPTRYSIASRVSGAGLYGGQGPIFDLYDAERGVTVGVRWVPTPERAAELLGQYGVPESELRDTPRAGDGTRGGRVTHALPVQSSGTVG